MAILFAHVAKMMRTVRILFRNGCAWKSERTIKSVSMELEEEIPTSFLKGVRNLRKGTSNPDTNASTQFRLALPLNVRLRYYLSCIRKGDIQKSAVILKDPAAPVNIARTVKRWVEDGFKELSNEDKSFKENMFALNFLIHKCRTMTDPVLFCATLLILQSQALTESNYNSILLCMDNFGWHGCVKTNFKEMKENNIKFRRLTLSHLILSTIQRDDLDFALELVQEFTSDHSNRHNLPFDTVLEGCVGKGERWMKLVEEILEWHRVSKVSLNQLTSDAFVRWIQSLNRRYKITETEIDPDGYCLCCGEKLEASILPKHAYKQLVEAVEDIITDLERRYNPEPLLPSLKRYLQRHDFGAVIDGLNTGMHYNGQFIPHHLLDVTKKLVSWSGKPVLIVLRKHSIQQMRLGRRQRRGTKSLPSDSIFEYNRIGIHFFFVHDFCDDDMYSLYAALASGNGTLLVSNDSMGDKRNLLPHQEGILLDQWKYACQAYLSEGYIRKGIEMPCKFKREIHWNREKHEGHIFVGDRDNFKGYYLCVKRLA